MPNGRRSSTTSITDTANKALVELTKCAGLVFSAVQPSYPWLRLLSLLTQACRDKVRVDLGLKKNSVPDQRVVEVKSVGSGRPTFTEVCTLMSHLLSSLPLDTQQQTEAARVMEVLSVLTGLITDHLDILSSGELVVGVKLCHGILEKLIPSVTLPVQDNTAVMSLASRPESRNSVLTHVSSSTHMRSSAPYAIANMSFPLSTAMIEESTGLSDSTSSAEDVGEGIIQIGIEASEMKSHSETSSQILGEDITDILPHDDDCDDHLDDDDDDDSSKQEQMYSDAMEQSIHNKETDSSHSTVGPDPASFENSSSHEIDGYASDREFQQSDFISNINREEDLPSLDDGTEVYALSSLYKYVLEFERFFCNFVQKRILADPVQLDEFQSMLLTPSYETSVGELKSLLKECLMCSMEQEQQGSSEVGAGRKTAYDAINLPRSLACGEDQQRSPPAAPQPLSSTVHLRHDFTDDMQTFEVSCAILVDLSSIPTTSGKPYKFSSSVCYLTPTSPRSSTDNESVNSSGSISSNKQCDNKKRSSSNNNNSLPGWLVALCSCTVSNIVTLQHPALAALLELLTLANSELSVWREGGTGSLAPNGEEGVLTINIIPRIHTTHMHLLLHHTSLYQV